MPGCHTAGKQCELPITVCAELPVKTLRTVNVGCETTVRQYQVTVSFRGVVRLSVEKNFTPSGRV